MNPILIMVWGILAAAFMALLVYRGQLTRYEDEQLFLNESNQTAQEKQTEIVKKIHKLSPVVTALGGAAGLVTASVVGIYVWNAWQNIQ